MFRYLDLFGPYEWACAVWFAGEALALLAICLWLVWKLRALQNGKEGASMPTLEFFFWLLVMAAGSGLLWKYFLAHVQNLPHSQASAESGAGEE